MPPSEVMTLSGPKRPPLPESVRSGGLAFGCFLLTTVTLFLRPAELVPELAEVPIYEVLVACSLAGSLGRIRQQMAWSVLSRRPVTICVLGLVIAVVLSHLSRLYFSLMVESGVAFAKTALYFLAFTALVDTPERLRKMLVTVTAGATCMIGLCVADYLGIADIPAITHYSERDGVTETNDEQRVLRMRGTGLFEDPNDISLIIVTTAVLCVWLAGDKSRGPVRFAWLAPLALMGLGLILTKSRGGLLAAGGAGVTFTWFRWGKAQAAALVVLGACAIPFLSGRLGQIDLEEGGTGQQRIELWRDGLQELKSPALAFGIGMGEYVELGGLVAHNSFVHSFVELGFVGGTLFFGCFLFAGLGLWRLAPSGKTAIRHPDLARLLPLLAAILAAWGVALLTLSRCYVVPTYLILGTLTAYIALAERFATVHRPPIVWNRSRFAQLVAGSSCLLVGLFVVVRVFA